MSATPSPRPRKLDPAGLANDALVARELHCLLILSRCLAAVLVASVIHMLFDGASASMVSATVITAALLAAARRLGTIIRRAR
jgi:hypothetical protein